MFNHMFLVIEENKLKDRFGGTVTTAILEVLNREEDEGNLEALYRVLSRFNGASSDTELFKNHRSTICF